MATNWLHYKANYAQLTTLVVALGLLVAHAAVCFMCRGDRVDGLRDGLSGPPHRHDRQLQRQTHDQEPRARRRRGRAAHIDILRRPDVDRAGF